MPKFFVPVILFLCGVFVFANETPKETTETNETPSKTDDTFWSLKPLVVPQVPPVEKTFVGFEPVNTIDRFVLSKHIEKGLTPSPSADRRTLIRRVYFDLIGLPPTADEVDEFVTDLREDAYERLVDRLLTSPQYGERWARHWMDVAHYAETHGHDQDRPRQNAWPYRDYLIQSFNNDTPYARFIEEQVAGDVLFPGDPQATVATGFLATGPWDESSLQSIQNDTDDRKIAQYLDRDDMVTTVMSSFVSATVHCARCHDHFFDPIKQADYYALQAVFAGVDKADRPYESDQPTARRRQSLQTELAQLIGLKGKADPLLLTPEMQQLAAAWEAKQISTPLLWQVLEPVEAKSSDGSTLTKQSDGSVLASEKRPEKDTYTLIFHTPLRAITAFRLELLTHDSLSHRGPGRQDNGNLHLSEIKVFANPLSSPSANSTSNASTTGEVKPLAVKNPRADFNQDGWTIAHALDGNPGTAWGIYPKVGEDHRAVIEFAQPINFEGVTVLTVILEQLHGGGHLIGRPRISVTNATESMSLDSEILPTEIMAILAKPVAERSDLQQTELARFVRIKLVERELLAMPALPMIYAASKRAPLPIHLLERGNVKQLGAEAVAGTLACVPGLPARFELQNSQDEGARRAALARWISDKRNVLTWRSIANRVWHHHFGRGLCDTPNDLGQMGARPTHPELLDWLACEIRDKDERSSLKHLHRLIVTSATYRQSSAHNDHWAAIDGDNRFLWRMNRTRLDAESIRDTVASMTGMADRMMGGPSVKQFIQTPGIHVTPNVDYANFDPDRPENFRRSVYRFIFRTLPDPLMDSLDCADSSQLTPVRNASLTALQALSMLNNKFIVRQSEHLASRLASSGGDLNQQVEATFRFALLRTPTDRERIMLTEYALQHGLANACRVLLNSNEFLFVD
ncbi:MAG: DUF1549 and DUF1553 domain-containing protein [Planctomycetia bacterium]|nr:DUF1549 and DUF1553 domain-containing protein [Planctomycetia bacterium]